MARKFILLRAFAVESRSKEGDIRASVLPDGLLRTNLILLASLLFRR